MEIAKLPSSETPISEKWLHTGEWTTESVTN